ncbi:MAG: CDP-alcohol phosphatidyltransferase family protein [Chloroflexi bacterium]|nr:CDP-alcohol phosphatidyltransferase family protein [Chloroflexota bacterium]
MIYDNRQSLVHLRWRWGMVATIYTAGLLLGYGFLRQQWQSGRETQWLSVAAAAMIIQLSIFWWALHLNHRPAEANLFPFLGYGNMMTLTRGLCAALLAGFLFTPRPTAVLAWVPAILYTLERLLDYFDGYVARITGQETKLGAILDMEFDGLGFLIAILLCIQYGQLPIWYLVLGLARQLFVAGLWLRQRWQKPIYPLPPSTNGRLIAGFQTSFVSVVLWPVLSPQITLLACYLFAIPLLYSFGRDWLVVSGILDADSHAYQTGRTAIKQFFEGWLPVFTRVVGALIAVQILWRVWGEAPLLNGSALLQEFFLLWVVAVLMVFLGVIGRIGALALVALACVEIGVTGLQWTANGLLLVCAIIVLHLGTGRFALWQPEERILRLKIGAR